MNGTQLKQLVDMFIEEGIAENSSGLDTTMSVLDGQIAIKAMWRVANVDLQYFYNWLHTVNL